MNNTEDNHACEHDHSTDVVALHVHSEYSLLDGAAKIDAINRAAAEDGRTAQAVTDHGNMYGSFEHYKSAKKHGLTPIIGVEMYLAPKSRFEYSGKRDANHVTLLAQNAEGYRNLVELVTIGWTEGYYYTPRIDMDILAKKNAGIICLSGCLSGRVQDPLKTGDYTAGKAAAQEYKDIFGDRFYLEIMRHGLPEQEAMEAYMLQLRNELGVKLVATNDSHYLKHEDHGFHSVMCCMQTGKVLSDPKRFHLTGEQFYLKSSSEMREVFHDLPEACDATLEIAGRIANELSGLEPSSQYHIPAYPMPEEKKMDAAGPVNQARYLRKLCLGGLKKRYGAERVANDSALMTQLDFELKVIHDMGFDSYFLIVWDFIKWARDNDIPVGPGRGSAVGSLVSYCLAITALDPIKNGLLFERFLNPDRISMPDIDTDFCIEGRGRVIQYVEEKYGKDRVAGIITFNTMAARGAVRDAGRVLEIPLPVVDKVSKAIPGGPKGMSIAQARQEIPEIRDLEKQDPAIRNWMDMAEKLEGYVKSNGAHASAYIIADAPITNYLPLHVDKKGGTDAITTQFEQDHIEGMGLLKMDFLGLRNLTVMRDAQNQIRKFEPDFEINNIRDDDKKTYAMLAKGETAGVFQLESDGMKRVCVDMKVSCFDDIVALVALYRPGPMDNIPDYVAGKLGKKTITYLHPDLEPILKDTYGFPVYQEQIMRMARVLAGFTMGDADVLRKVMGKKKPEMVAGERTKFIAGALKNGVSQEVAEAIFRFMEPFAGYGFNKSHAVAYGWIAYQTAYLKANYPLQYLAALMSSVGDKTDKLVEYLHEAKRMNISILPPDVNSSETKFAVVGNDIRFGFGAVKGITEASVEGIIRERDENGPFKTIFELVDRTRKYDVQRKTVESLARVGACDGLEGHRAQQVAALDQAYGLANIALRDAQLGQINLFGDISGEDEIEAPKLPAIVPATTMEMLTWEREGMGIYVSGHPIDDYTALFEARKALTVNRAKERDNMNVLVGGMVSAVRRTLTKAGKMMLIGTIEDRTGSIEVLLFSAKYEMFQSCFVVGQILAVSGQVKVKQAFGAAADKSEDDENEDAPAVEMQIMVNGAEVVNAVPATPEMAVA